MNRYEQAWATHYTQYQQYIAEVIHRRKLLASAAVLITLDEPEKRRRRRRRCWVTRFLKQRHQYGAFHTTVPQLLHNDIMFHNYCRMSRVVFEELIQLIGPVIKRSTYIREPISPDERLLLTLRYLASGDSMMSIKYQYYVSQPTISGIISDTCEALWEVLAPLVLSPPTHEDWKQIARDFENNCQFPHCIGAVDGKHVVIQAPGHAGSAFYNYKGSHSIVLMAICDSHYCFRIVDIGAQGRQSEGGIWNNSEMGQKFMRGEMGVPPPEVLSERYPAFPYVFVGDEAFQLSGYLMRPYPGKGGLTRERKIYNYRLSRARRIVENSFGILVSQWRIYRKPIIASLETVERIIKSTICLHNWLRRNNNAHMYCPQSEINRENVHGPVASDTCHQAVQRSAFQDIRNASSNTNTRRAEAIRVQFTRYFSNEGAVEWQDRAIS